MLKILIGIATTREDKRFLESLDLFISDIKGHYDFKVMWKRNVRLKDAQNRFALECIDGHFDYLLLLDDDHSGHTKQMLDCLINAKAYMATIKTYSRHYPYFCCLMNKIQNETIFSGIEYGEGYIECDMTGFGMSLIKRDLFELMDYPYFEEETEGGRDWVTDTVFCRRLNTMGIKPVGCFQYCLPHGDITAHNVIRKRREDGISKENFIMQMVYEKFSKGDILCMAHQ